MPDRMREAVAPAYLLMALILGGSAQGIWTNVLLQLSGTAIIAWSLMSAPEEPLARPVRWLAWIALGLFAFVLLQLVPLPASVWPSLGGRSQLASDFRLLGESAPALPLSLTPYETGATLLRVIPAVAMFCAIMRLRAYRKSWLAFALIGGTLAGILLGAMQVASAAPVGSRWYLYPQSSWGQAVGFFANANHMGDLLVVTLPFLAAVLAGSRRKKVQQYSGIAAIVVGIALVIMVGIALNRSVAAYVLAIPVAVASLLMLKPASLKARALGMAGAGAFAIAAAIVALGPLGDRMLGSSISVSSRAEMARTTTAAAIDFAPFGSGLGSFRAVYRLYENPDTVDRVATNHAHNDYLELALETGFPGVLAMLAFLGWWMLQAGTIWRSHGMRPYRRAAVIASGAILVHSFVDFPLRTAALSCVFAMCLALMVVRKRKPRDSQSDLWPTRHMGLE